MYSLNINVFCFLFRLSSDFFQSFYILQVFTVKHTLKIVKEICSFLNWKSSCKKLSFLPINFYYIFLISFLSWIIFSFLSWIIFSRIWTRMWTRICEFKFPACENCFLHTWHLYGFSPVCTLICLVKCPPSVNFLLHTWHWYGFSPVCTLIYAVKYPAWVNFLLHTWHLNGFSPVCTLMCRTKVCLVDKILSQISHLFSIVQYVITL